MGNPYYLLTSVKYHVFNLVCLSELNPINPPTPTPPQPIRDSDICRTLQNKLEVDLLNIVQLKVAAGIERSQAR